MPSSCSEAWTGNLTPARHVASRRSGSAMTRNISAMSRPRCKLIMRKPAASETPPRVKSGLDHDDFGLIQSKIMNVIDSNNLERDSQISSRNLLKLDCAGNPVPTFPHPALAAYTATSVSPSPMRGETPPVQWSTRPPPVALLPGNIPPLALVCALHRRSRLVMSCAPLAAMASRAFCIESSRSIPRQASHTTNVGYPAAHASSAE